MEDMVPVKGKQKVFQEGE